MNKNCCVDAKLTTNKKYWIKHGPNNCLKIWGECLKNLSQEDRFLIKKDFDKLNEGTYKGIIKGSHLDISKNIFTVLISLSIDRRFICLNFPLKKTWAFKNWTEYMQDYKLTKDANSTKCVGRKIFVKVTHSGTAMNFFYNHK